ncbi:unnamed protein product [Blepharisma stoltei]|uniref:Uncharacterized protein n=1 Tax=Blepharisma stoltei TaxID=1481888 RepID=A0AAU9JX23_9CILI|nr:unnamed protein product [Blepharisma stoltei]
MKNTTGYIFLRQQREFMELYLHLKFHMKTSIKNLLFGFLNSIKMGDSDFGKTQSYEYYYWLHLFKAAKGIHGVVLII